MEQEEQRAYEQFRQQKDLLDKEPAFAAAFSVPAEELDKGRRQDIFVPREELFTAARRHLSRTRAAATEPPATVLPPPSGTRRLV